jgi:aryl-alcohol dehydrogenase-like predicted oxidoreductase
MQIRDLGKTGLKASVLGFGTMELRYLTEANAVSMLNGVLDRGITYIDTAPEYPMAEYFIGKAISKRRDEYVLASKCGDNLSGSGPKYLFDRKTIIDNVEESLRLMKTDRIDVMQIHAVIPEYLPGGPEGEAWKTLRELKKTGKILHIGVTTCNKAPEDYGYPATYGYNSILRFAPWPELEIIQSVYGCMTRLSEKVIEKAHEDYGIGIIARGVLKQYTNLYSERFEVSRVKELFESGENMNDFFIRYALSNPGLSNILIGTRQIDHLVDNIKAANKGPLPPDLYLEAKRRMNFSGNVPGPVDMKLDWQPGE